MEKNFLDHLINIGIIDKNSKNKIISIYNSLKEKNENKNQFNKKMTEILLSFFNTLTEVQKKFMCFHLPVKFIKLCELKINNKLRNILHIHELKNKIILMKYLFRWYRCRHYTSEKNNKNKINIDEANLDNSKNIFRQQSYKQLKSNRVKKKISYGINNNICNALKDFVKNVNNSNISNYNSKNEIIDYKFAINNNNNQKNKKDKKERTLLNKKNLANFNINLSPDNKENINNLNNRYINNTKNDKKKKVYINNNYISQLIKDYTPINKNFPNNNPINKELINSNDSNENYISTNINSTHRYESKKEKTNEKKIVNTKTYINNNSNSNLNIFNTPQTTRRSIPKKNVNIKLRNYNSNKYNLVYCNNYNNLNNNIYSENNNNNIDLNLFIEKTPFCEREIKTIETNKYPKNSLGQRLYEHGVKKLKNKKNLKNSSPTPLLKQKEKSKSVNYKHINSLYKNQKRCKTLEKVKNKVEKEEGLTFKPTLYKSNYIERINSNFMERNYSSPRSEKTDYKYNEDNNIDKYKKLDKKEKENIVKGLINRLYKKKKFDENEENSFLCKKYEIKGLKGSYFLKGYKKKVE